MLHGFTLPLVARTFYLGHLGKKHLIYALDSGDQQIFLLALHDVMDAILEELESERALINEGNIASILLQ